MRPMIPRDRRAVAALGALSFAVTVPAAPAAAQSPAGGAQAAPRPAVAIRVADRTLRFGQRLVVRGRIRGTGGGARLLLQHRTAGGPWRTVASATAGGGGRFRLRARATLTGRVRVVAAPPAALAAGVASAPAASAETRVAVAVDVVPRRRRLDVLAGRRALVRGAIRPGVPGRRVALQRRTARGWATIARARTRSGGRFVLRARSRRPLSARVRVRVAGGTGHVAAREAVGRLNVYRHAMVSWYGPGLYGQRLGCGGTLRPGQLGVAHKTLPCGARLTLRHGRRTVHVRVIDRGPYVGGREFDLTAATKDRLRFAGAGSVQVTR